MLNQDDILRYSRHFPVIGLEGQSRLKQARVLCVGAGGLASGALPPLVAAGVGCLGIVDGDVVACSNLQRQVMFREADIGRNKAQVAKTTLQALNSGCELIDYPFFMAEDNAAAIIEGYDIIIDATDNYEARYLLNRVSRQQQTPLVMASIFQFDAQVSVFNDHDGPCYECLYPAPPPPGFMPSCATGGVLGVLPNVVGGLQATQVIKIVLGLGESLSGKLLTLDLSSLQMKCFPLQKRRTCRRDHCSDAASMPVQQQPKEIPLIDEISAHDLAPLLSQADYCLLDVREPYEREICCIDGGVHIPLGQLAARVDELPRDKVIVAYCKGGVRSLQAAAVLQGAGYSKVLSLAGGILAWRDAIEPDMMAY